MGTSDQLGKNNRKPSARLTDRLAVVRERIADARSGAAAAAAEGDPAITRGPEIAE